MSDYLCPGCDRPADEMLGLCPSCERVARIQMQQARARRELTEAVTS